MNKRLVYILVFSLLIFVFLIGILSIRDDSLTMDELAHLPAGYSYLTQRDMRLNPEHPPLIKDLAAIPLLFMRGIKFPSNIPDWQNDINGQWGFGYHFLFTSDNPADKMIFWGRIPMILILTLLGLYMFKWTKELFGEKTALLSLFLFSFSPAFLAHGRLVTTDVGASIGVIAAIYYFLKALKEPSGKNIVLAGIFLGIAELLKFSLIILIPFFIFLALVRWWTKLSTFKQVLKVSLLTLVLGYLLVLPVYQYHVWNYPVERQARDIRFLLSSHQIKSIGPLLAWMSDKPVLGAYAQYLLGLFLVFQRGVGGHTTYFLGEISAAGWKNYFPVVYSIKEPLTFHILTIIALIYFSLKIELPFWRRPIFRLRDWIGNHFAEFSILVFILAYWAGSLVANLNIGVRHLLPVLPLTFILVSKGITDLLKKPYLKLKYLLLSGLLLWQMVSVISIYPHFLSYFNEIVGRKNSYLYTVDSNLDWGQDLKRLTRWVEENNIGKIYVDYFGGADTRYYLKEKYLPWRGTQNPEEMERPAYLAVSVSFLQGGRGMPDEGFDKPYGYYHWLDNENPIAKIGYSIFVYHLK